MSHTWRITCINKSDRHNPHERIRNIGGTESGGWKLTLDQAIAEIRKGNKFWVHAGGKSVWVEIARHNGHEYLKTEADGDQPNNLLSLPECP